MDEWTTTPPTEPGWYWWRKGDYPKRPMQVWQFDESGPLIASTRPTPVQVEGMGGEWWPARIEEPACCEYHKDGGDTYAKCWNS